jgi:hypothetical protein
MGLHRDLTIFCTKILCVGHAEKVDAVFILHYMTLNKSCLLCNQQKQGL